MTIITKSKEVNGRLVEISQEKFETAYKVTLYTLSGYTDLYNYYSNEKKATACFYRYCQIAKNR